jgi:fibronectin type 3 domain-containing protein
MFERHPNLIALRGLMVALCLALLSGCLPRTTNPAAPIPSNLTATGGQDVVTLTWTASSGATGYNVKRATSSGGPYTQLAAPASPGYSDSSVIDGTPYYYVVSALNPAGESGNSAEASATPKAPSAPPAAPTNLAAAIGDSSVSLTWTASSGATSYYVKRSTTSGGPYTRIATPASTSYTDTSLTNGTTYYYVVSATNSVGESPNSGQVSAAPSPPPPTTFGTWTNVTPAGVNLGALPCGNFGTTTVQADPAHPSNLYAEFNCQGIWKSTDYGLTWTGPINTGTGPTPANNSGGITIAPTSTKSIPTIYRAVVRGAGTGFWKSVDGGVNWTHYLVAPSGAGRQDYFPPVTDPYDENHLLMAAHEQDFVVASVDGGQNWTNVPLAGGMKQNVSGVASGAIFFIDTGNAATTRGNWLWMGQQSGGTYGTWLTANSGATWNQVDKNEHGGVPQIYQPGNNGVVYMAGAYSALGSGVLRSNDYGQTWTHVGLSANEAVVIGTAKNVYAMFGYPVGAGASTDPSFEVASQPGTGTWVAPGTPAGLTQGAAQIAIVNDGTNNIAVGAMYNSGLWRYIEP